MNLTRRHLLVGSAGLVSALVISVTPVFPEGDVWLGFRDEHRMALKRVVWSRVYGAQAAKQSEVGGDYMPSQEAILEAEKRLFTYNNFPIVNKHTRRVLARKTRLA